MKRIPQALACTGVKRLFINYTVSDKEILCISRVPRQGQEANVPGQARIETDTNMALTQWGRGPIMWTYQI